MTFFTFDQAFINLMNSVLLISAFCGVSFYAGRLYERVRFSFRKHLINRLFKAFGESVKLNFTIDERVGTEFAGLINTCAQLVSSVNVSALNEFFRTAGAHFSTYLNRTGTEAPVAEAPVAEATEDEETTPPAAKRFRPDSTLSGEQLLDIFSAHPSSTAVKTEPEDEPEVESKVESEVEPKVAPKVEPESEEMPLISVPGTTPSESDSEDDKDTTDINTHDADNGMRKRIIRIVRS